MKNRSNELCAALCAITVAAVGLAVSGCNKKNGQEDGLETVKVAINTWPGLGPYFVAKAKGFDKEEGIVLEVTITEDTVARRSALAAGDVDLVGITLDTVIVANSRGIPMVVVAQSDFSNGGDGILAKKEIESVKDLRGKKVACAEGLPSHFFLLYVLRENGLKPSDVDLVPADDGSQAGQLFASGRVDAAVTWDPWISRADELTKGKGHVITTTRDTPRVVLGIVAANKKLLPERKERIAKAQRAWFKAVEFCRENPEEAAKIMATEFNVPDDEFREMAKGAELADLAETKETFGTASSPGPVEKLASDASELWLTSGVTKKAVQPSDVIDWSVLELLESTAD